jgi:hypothetical protein
MAAITASVIFCDDIRTEANGKFFLIGIYNGEMITYQNPYLATLATWITVHGLSNGDHTYTIRVAFDDSHQIVHVSGMEGAITIVDENLPATIAPTGLVVNLDRQGWLKIFGKFDENDEIELGRLRITPSRQQ